MARERSPNYPAIDLAKAIGAVGDLYTKEGRSGTPLEVAAKAWGYAGLSGPARSKIAALRHYGLVTQSKGNLRVTDLALTLILQSPGSQERKNAIKRAALNPALFSELWDEKHDASEDGLRHHLVVNKRFTEDGATRVIQAYQATMELADLGDEGYPEGDEPTKSEDDGSQLSAGSGKYTLPVSPTESITLWGNFPITPGQWEQMMSVLEAMKPALVDES